MTLMDIYRRLRDNDEAIHAIMIEHSNVVELRKKVVCELKMEVDRAIKNVYGVRPDLGRKLVRRPF